MIVKDLREIAKVVLGSGLPDSLYKEGSLVYDKIQSVGSILDITPRQVVMLSVAIHIGTRSVNRRTIARFCECTEDFIMSYKWDLISLCLKGYLNVSSVYPDHKVYSLPFGLLECWEKGKAYRTNMCFPSEVKLNRQLFADQVFNNILKPFWTEDRPTLYLDAQKTLKTILYEFSAYSLCRHVQIACSEQFCPSPSLGQHILLLIIANTMHPMRGKDLGKDEVRTILFGANPTEPEVAEFFCTMDFLIKTNRLEWDGKSLKLAGMLLDWIVGDLDMDLVIPYESL